MEISLGAAVTAKAPVGPPTYQGHLGKPMSLGSEYQESDPALCHTLVLPEPRGLAAGAGLTQEVVLEALLWATEPYPDLGSVLVLSLSLCSGLRAGL